MSVLPVFSSQRNLKNIISIRQEKITACNVIKQQRVVHTAIIDESGVNQKLKKRKGLPHTKKLCSGSRSKKMVP